MKFFINNVKLLLNFRIILIIIASFFINVFYSGKNFPQVIYGVDGPFSLNTAIPYLALIFPFFLMTGAFISQYEDNKLFVMSRMKKRKYSINILLILLFSAFIYSSFCGIIPCLFCGEFSKNFFSAILLFFYLLFLSNIQLIIFVFSQNSMASILVPFFIIVSALAFYKSNFIGSWAMLNRSNVINERGFNVVLAITLEVFFTVIVNCILILRRENKCQL